jgi:two-component system NarL family sensor kinase
MQNPWEIFIWPIFAGTVAVLLSLLFYFGHDLGWPRIISCIRFVVSAFGNAAEREAKVREDTLRSVSLELHDRVGHILTVALLHLDRNQNSSSHSPPPTLIIQRLLTEALEAIRHISSSYNAEQLVLLGLSASIKKELEFLESAAHFTTHTEFTGEPFFLDDGVETAVYRIFQEIMTNIIRHARARDVHVLLGYSPSFLLLSVRDNGKGFDVGRQLNRSHSKGNGLSNIIRRTRSIGGIPEIASAVNVGTTVSIKIPTKNKQRSDDKDSIG